MRPLHECDDQKTGEVPYSKDHANLSALEQGQLASIREFQPDQDLSRDQLKEEIILNGTQRNWNKPTTEGHRSSSTGLEQMGSEPSRLPTHDGVLDQSAGPYMSRNHYDFTRTGAVAQDQMSSHFSQKDDESYMVPHYSTSSAPRMIQQGNQGRSLNHNAFRRLKNMSNTGELPEKLPSLPPPGDLGPYGYPTTKAEEKKPEKKYPGSKEYQMTRCFCCWTTFLTVFLLCCALGTGAIALIKMKEGCEPVSATLVVTDVIVFVIVVLEWVRLWLWREPLAIRQKPSLRKAAKEGISPMSSMGPMQGGSTLPAMLSEPGPLPNATYIPRANNTGSAGGFLTQGFQQRLYDVPQFISALFLILLYFIGTICVIGTIAASASKLSNCSLLSTTALGFSAMLAILILMRLVMCCMSDGCHGVIHKTAMAAASAGEPVPIVAVNQLHQVLPGLGKQLAPGAEGAVGTQQPTAWLMNLANASDPRQQLSIVQPMPVKFSHDFAQVS